MRIRLNRKYTGGGIRHLPENVYNEHDPRLQGRASYLVSIGVAEWVDENASLPEERLVKVEYVGGNVRAHEVRVEGVAYQIPKHEDDKDGVPVPRIILVPAPIAKILKDRITFNVVREG